jgi:hypothetical protein
MMVSVEESPLVVTVMSTFVTGGILVATYCPSIRYQGCGKKADKTEHCVRDETSR